MGDQHTRGSAPSHGTAADRRCQRSDPIEREVLAQDSPPTTRSEPNRLLEHGAFIGCAGSRLGLIRAQLEPSFSRRYFTTIGGTQSETSAPKWTSSFNLEELT